MGEGGDEIVGRGGLVLLDEGHEGCGKGWVGVEDSVEESGGVGGGEEIVGRGVNKGGDISGCGSVGGCDCVGDGIDVGVGGAHRKWGSIGGDIVGGDGVYVVGGLGCHGRHERDVVEVGGVIVIGVEGSVGIHLSGHGRRMERCQCVGRSACCNV